MDIHCRSCGIVTAVKQQHQYHAGFSNVGFLYCKKCPNMVVFHTYDTDYSRVAGDVHPWMLTTESKILVERALKNCTCGSSFGFDALPRCPHCNEELPGLLEDKIHYVEIGNVLNGTQMDIWRPETLGTS